MAKLASIYRKNKGIENSTPVLSSDAIIQAFLNLIPKVNVFSVNSRIFAKESMNLPMMARDTNVMRQNISKLVTHMGITPIKKADSFFERASEREKLYESSFTKESKTLKSKTPTTIAPSKFAQKAVDYGAVALGLAGFFGALTIAGNLINNVPGGLAGIRDMLSALADGLGAFSLDSFLKFGALLAGGALFGSAVGIKRSIGGGLGIASIGLGIGGFFAGLTAGGVIGDLIGNSAGVKEMMINLADGLGAFNGDSFIQFSALLAAGGIFGAVTGLAGKGGAMLGMGAVGAGLGLFFSGLSAGGAIGTMMNNNPTMIKDLLVNVADGLNALTEIDGSSLVNLIPILPVFGISLAAFLGMEGIGNVIQTLGAGITKAMNFIFGERNNKSPMQKIAEDLSTFENVNADVAKVGQGFIDLMAGVKTLADLSDNQMQQAIKNGTLALTLAERLSKTQANQPTPASAGGPGVRRADDPRRLDYDSSDVSVQMGPNGEFASKNDFLLKMYPLAIQASKDLGGIDPSALLTQWGFESAWGKKVTGNYNYFGIKADSNWTGEKKDTPTTEYIAGEKKSMIQSFRSYNSPEEAVGDYVNFLKNNQRYRRAGLFEAKTAEEYFQALQRAGYATDPEYAKKLTSATQQTSRQVAGLTPSVSTTQVAAAPKSVESSSIGATIATTSSAITQAAITLNSVPPTVVVNVPTQSTKSFDSVDTKIASTVDFEFSDAMFGTFNYA